MTSLIKMCTLVDDNGQWTSKIDKNMFVQKVSGPKSYINVEHSCFNPLCYIMMNGY